MDYIIYIETMYNKIVPVEDGSYKILQEIVEFYCVLSSHGTQKIFKSGSKQKSSVFFFT